MKLSFVTFQVAVNTFRFRTKLTASTKDQIFSLLGTTKAKRCKHTGNTAEAAVCCNVNFQFTDMHSCNTCSLQHFKFSSTFSKGFDKSVSIHLKRLSNSALQRTSTKPSLVFINCSLGVYHKKQSSRKHLQVRKKQYFVFYHGIFQNIITLNVNYVT